MANMGLGFLFDGRHFYLVPLVDPGPMICAEALGCAGNYRQGRGGKTGRNEDDRQWMMQLLSGCRGVFCL